MLIDYNPAFIIALIVQGGDIKLVIINGMKINIKTKTLSTIVLVLTVGLFCSTAIQVGLAINLHVPTVPLNITMTSVQASGLAGLAARDWAAGTCMLFAVIGLLAIFDRFDRRTAHTIIGYILFLTLIPIFISFFTGTTPDGADWIVMHHVIAGTLIFVTRPKI